jgi:penicillin-insensitive murein DD-endopeptidase
VSSTHPAGLWVALLCASAWVAPAALARETPASECVGTPSRGQLRHGVALPERGRNFSPYSTLAVAAGRTHVHSTVRDIVVQAYRALEASAPGTVFVYGETGWPQGGRFAPHRTHQNGLSVDFMVPVRNAAGQSVPLPTRVSQRYGYDLEFDASGRLGGLRIDFEAVAQHLVQLQRAAAERGVVVGQVIFDPRYLPLLQATPSGAQLKGLPFMRKDAWVRHDEHYHVDFVLPCRPLR